MGTREDLIAEIQRLEETQALEAELAKRNAPVGQKKLGEVKAAAEKLPEGLFGFAKESLKNLGVGTLEGADMALQGHPILGPLLNFIGMKTTGKTPRAAINELPVEDLGTFGKTLRGAGAGVLGAPAAGAIPAAMASGGMAALSGEAGGNAAERFGLPRAAGEIPAALLGGGVTGMGLGPKQTPAHAQIRDAAEGTNWNVVKQNVADLQGSGAKTATLAEAFPRGHAMRDEQAIVRAGTSSNALKDRMVNREGDMAGLGQEFLNRVAPKNDPNAVAGAAVDKANTTRSVLEGMRSKDFGDTLKGVVITPIEGFSTYRRLIAEAKSHPDPDYREALAEVAKRFLDEHKKNAPITDVQTLSLRLKRLKDAEASPTAATGTVINKMDTKKAVAYAEELLGQISPKFAEANQKFQVASRNIEEQLSGGFGRLADKNPVTASEPTVNKLNPLFASGGDDALKEAIARLQTPGPTFGPPVKGADVTRAWAQQRLDRMPAGGNPAEMVRGGPDTSANARIAAALEASGKDPKSTMQPLRAADLMAGSPVQGGTKEVPKMLPLQWLIRTLRSADMTVTRHGMEKMDREVARLLSDPANLAEVQKIAMFDPAVRRQLSLMAPLLGLTANQERP